MAHAILSPSGASRWMYCFGSIDATRDLADTTNDAADEGTAAHWLAEHCLNTDSDAVALLGRIIMVYNGEVYEDPSAPIPPRLKGQDVDFISEHEVDEDFAEFVQVYVDTVRGYSGGRKTFLTVEQKVSIDFMTGEVGAEGTADAVIEVMSDLRAEQDRDIFEELIVVDLKFGKSPRGIKYAEDADGNLNEQLGIYAAGVLHARAQSSRIYKRIRMIILQPRLGHESEAVRTPQQMYEFSYRVAQAAKRALLPESSAVFAPGGDRCTFCKAFPTCAAAQEMVTETVQVDFESLDAAAESNLLLSVADMPGERVAQIMPRLNFIDQWCRAVMRHGEAMILANPGSVPGYKVVLGKKGGRKWADPQAAEKVLRGLLPDELIYTKKLNSPPAVEKVLKPAKSKAEAKALLTQLQDFITQAPPSRSVVPDHDKRAAVEDQPVVFESEGTEDLA